MKTIISMLTASALFSVLLTGCGIQQEENTISATSAPEIHIDTIPAETQALTTVPPVETSAPETETVLLTEAAEILPSEIIPAELPSTEAVSSEPKTTLVYQYNDILFDKAIFAALLDSIGGTSGTQYFFVSDPDRDGASEFLVTLPETSVSSRNLIFENMTSAGIYYYNATGAENDFYVIDPVTGNVYLNENTRSDDGIDIISREYFEWTGSKWQSACMLYRNNCYWNYEPVTVEQFLQNADAMNRITAEDIFNLTISGTPESAADAFYQYLSKSFKLERPIAADVDGDGFTEQILFVQNLSQKWCANIKDLYQEADKEPAYLDTEALSNVHTTCFVLDSVGAGRVRIRSENFDRRYRFTQSGGKLFAYDDMNIIQTVQYSAENDDFGKHFLSVAMMMG